VALGTLHPELLVESLGEWGALYLPAPDGRSDCVPSGSLDYPSDGSDDATSLSPAVVLWDAYVGSDQDPIRFAPTNSATLMGVVNDNAGWFEGLGPSVTTNPRAVSLSIHLSTVTPTRNPVFLVLPNDYSGIYNVTDHGLTTSRRYVGEPTFYALFVNLTDPSYGYQSEKQTWLVPRIVFFDTYLSTRLNKADNMTGTWLSDSANKVQFSQNSSSGPGTSALEGTLTANVDFAEYTTMRDWLMRNTSGNVTHTYVRIDWEPAVGDYFFLLGLPDAIVQLASYQALPNTASTTYAFDYRPVWQRIRDGTVGAALGWIASGFVAALNFMANLPEMLAQLGAWLWSAVVGAAQAVASAVQAAGEVLGAVVDWIVSMAISVITSAISGLLNAVKLLFDNTVGRLVQELETALAVIDPVELANRVASLLQLLSVIVIAVALIPVAIRVASVAIKAVTGAVSWLVETAISEGVAQFIVRVLMGIAFSLATTALFTAILETIGWVEDTTVAFFKTLGIAAASIAAQCRRLSSSCASPFSSRRRWTSRLSRDTKASRSPFSALR